MDEQAPSYDEALVELQDILEQLQGESTNLDELYRLVSRAGFLIQLCKDRLRHTETQINQLLKDEEES